MRHRLWNVRGVQIGAGTTLRQTGRAVHGDLPEESVLLDIDEGVAVRLQPNRRLAVG